MRLYANEPVSRDMRWHKLALSVQATQLSRLEVPSSKSQIPSQKQEVVFLSTLDFGLGTWDFHRLGIWDL